MHVFWYFPALHCSMPCANSVAGPGVVSCCGILIMCRLWGEQIFMSCQVEEGGLYNPCPGFSLADVLVSEYWIMVSRCTNSSCVSKVTFQKLNLRYQKGQIAQYPEVLSKKCF